MMDRSMSPNQKKKFLFDENKEKMNFKTGTAKANSIATNEIKFDVEKARKLKEQHAAYIMGMGSKLVMSPANSTEANSNLKKNGRSQKFIKVPDIVKKQVAQYNSSK